MMTSEPSSGFRTNVHKSKAPTQLKILRMLCQGELHHSEVVQGLNLTKSTVSESINPLGKNGYVKTTKGIKRPSDNKLDARYKKIRITLEGFNFLVENTNTAEEFFDILFDIFSSGQARDLKIKEKKQITLYEEKVLKIKSENFLNSQITDIFNQTFEWMKSNKFKNYWKVLEYFGIHGKMSYKDPRHHYWDNPKTGTSNIFLNLLNNGLLTRYSQDKFGLSILGLLTLIYHYSFQFDDESGIELSSNNFARFRNDYEIEGAKKHNSKVFDNLKEIILNYGDLLPRIFPNVKTNEDIKNITKIISSLAFHSEFIEEDFDEITLKILFSYQTKNRNDAMQSDLEYMAFSVAYDKWITRVKCNYPIFDRKGSFTNEFFDSFYVCAVRNFDITKIPKDTKLIKFDQNNFMFRWYIDPRSREYALADLDEEYKIDEEQQNEILQREEVRIREEYGISYDEYVNKVGKAALRLENKINQTLLYLINKYVTGKIDEKSIKKEYDELITTCLKKSHFSGILTEQDHLKNMFNSLLELVKVKDVILHGPHRLGTDFIKKNLDIDAIQNVISFQFFTCLRNIDEVKFKQILEKEEISDWYSDWLKEIHLFNSYYDKKYNEEIANLAENLQNNLIHHDHL